MLHCVALCCSVLQCVAVCCSVLQCVAGFELRNREEDGENVESVSQCANVFCNIVQYGEYVAVCCSVLQ